MVTFGLIVLLWVLCGILAWGYTMGEFSSEWPYFNHINIASWMAAFGPVGLGVAYLSGKGEFRLRPMSKEERWEAFHKAFPALDRSYFEEAN